MPARFTLLVVLFVTVVAVAAAHASVTVVSERYRSYIPGPYTPDCLAEDDILDWEMSGSLVQGESSSYTPALDSCESRTVWGTFVFRGAHRSDHPDVHAVLSADGDCTGCGTFHDDGIQYGSVYDCFFGKPCWKGTFCVLLPAAAQPDGTGRNQFDLLLENLGPGSAPFVYVTAESTMSWDHVC